MDKNVELIKKYRKDLIILKRRTEDFNMVRNIKDILADDYIKSIPKNKFSVIYILNKKDKEDKLIVYVTGNEYGTMTYENIPIYILGEMYASENDSYNENGLILNLTESFIVKIDVDCILYYEPFEKDDAGLITGWDWISDEFKKEFFKI